MKIPPVIEKISWIAGIIGTAVALVSYFWPSSPPATATASTGTSISQSAGANSTQIGTVAGNVTVNNHAPNGAMDTEPVDIDGVWNSKSADRLIRKKLEATPWDKIDPDLEKPLEHSEVGEFNLVYKAKEGMVVAFGTITKGSECHACAPHLSFFEFEKRAKGWKLITENIAVLNAGSWGAPPKLSAYVIGDDKYAIFEESGYTAQGWTVMGVSVHVRMGDRFREVLHMLTDQSDPNGRSWSSTMATRPTTTGLYDIVVSRKGDKSDADLIWMDGNADLKGDVADSNDRIRRSDTFKFDGQRYRRSSLLN